MSFGVDNSSLIWAGLLALLPLIRSPFQNVAYPWNALLPQDRLSVWLGRSVRCAGMIAILALVFGIAGLHMKETSVERIGKGARIVLLLDRSRSMDDSFAGRTPSGAEAAKSAVAERVLSDFIAERKHDLFGVAAFSTSPLFVLPLTENREAVLAAVRASKQPGLAQTNVSKGLAMALSYFGADGRELSGANIITLVSDGAAVVDPQTEAYLRRWFKQHRIHLYWIFLRTAGSPGLFETPQNPDDDNAEARPERYLHMFFNGLGVPYQAYEAESPDAVTRAMAEIDRVENQTLRYFERMPRKDMQSPCYALATLALGFLFFAKWMEVRTCSNV
ncbi:VWA domain-containing protein [Candidatus Methylospira mobilis]|uniref:VWA domain-containing protein n=2 Tax=Candidatus Methylospira mobilis TaxID=1808979 RepID=A0A5Q0BRW5_9GAMM|nr:VWA domain-containing protein [Candidatus Methylospira mobilis]